MTDLAYILAPSHSGSTLLSMLLGSHPQIATIGEINLSPEAMGDLSRYRCSCGRPIRRCEFWKDVRKGMADQGIEFDLARAGTDYRAVDSRYAQRLLRPLFRGGVLERGRDLGLSLSPRWRKRLPETQKRNATLAAVVTEVTQAKIIVDSSKIALRLKYLLRNPDLNIKVVRLVRDGRAVALTYMDPAGFADARDPDRRAGGMGGDRDSERLPMAQAAHQWRRCVEEAESILPSLDRSQWIEVRYEDYCRHSDETLSRIQKFLGVDPHRQPVDFRSVEQHVVGNGMRLDTVSEIQLDERWRQRLTTEELKVFDDVAGAVNRRYGYV